MMLSALMRRRERLIDQLARPLSPLLAALFEDWGAGMLAAAPDGRIVRTNHRLDAMLSACGMKPLPVVAAEALFVPADRPRVSAIISSALLGDPPPPLLQVRLLASDPAVAPPVALSATPLRESSGEISGLVLRLIDVSAEKRLEAELAQLQKMQAVGQLAGGIAHDFNNVLAAIGAAVDSVLEREDAAAAMLDDLRQIRASVDRGAALVRQLLAFGRRQPLQPAVVAINPAVRNLSTMLSRLLGEHIRLELELEEPGRASHVDPTQFDQVLINLAVNARDAMPAGGTLTLRTGHLTLYQPRPVGSDTMPPGRYVAVSVEDTGEGIAAAVLPNVFEPFFTTRRDRGGNGLGLSTVHGIVDQSGGFVTIESTVGAGTKVQFWLPRHQEPEVVSAPLAAPGASAADPVPAAAPAVVPAPAAQPAVTPAAQPAVAPAGRCVLLVEDEEPLRRLVERALRRAGWQVCAVDSAEAALAGLPHPGDAAGAPCVLVSDVMLPGMDGTELVRAVRSVWPNLPAVLVSGYTDSALLGDLVTQRVSFLAKPFGLKELVSCVERAAA